MLWGTFECQGRARSILSGSRGEVSVGLSENLTCLEGSGKKDKWVKWDRYKNNQLGGSHYSALAHSGHSGTQSHLARTSDFPKEAKNKKSYVKCLTLKVLTTNKNCVQAKPTCLWARGGLTPRPLYLGVCRAELGVEGPLGQEVVEGRSEKGPAREPGCFVSLSVLTEKSEGAYLWGVYMIFWVLFLPFGIFSTLVCQGILDWA